MTIIFFLRSVLFCQFSFFVRLNIGFEFQQTNKNKTNYDNFNMVTGTNDGCCICIDTIDKQKKIHRTQTLIENQTRYQISPSKKKNENKNSESKKHTNQMKQKYLCYAYLL